MHPLRAALSALLFLPLLFIHCAAAASFEIRNGDRVLLLGDTLLEREVNYGHLETRMQQQFPDARFTVRNLGYSADTPLGISRSVFDAPEKGWERLLEQIEMVKPTVVFLGYGMASSMNFAGSPTDRMAEPPTSTEEKVKRFRAEMTQLMDAIDKQDPATKVRYVLLAPVRHEDLRKLQPGTPDPAGHNATLEAITAALEKLARERGAMFVPAFDTNTAASLGVDRLTDNGIHLTEPGYGFFAKHVASALGWDRAAQPEIANALRPMIQKKNELFFHRWRPQNQTYLFGFRKHEQGQNAKEIEMFDPLIAAEEAEIDKVKSGAAPAQVAKEEERPLAVMASVPPPQFDVQEGYEIALWAENPLLEKPVQMNWDVKGRLWVASSGVYPQIEPGAPATDRILLIEDTDRDGTADKSTIFADGLLIPTGVAPDVIAGSPGQNAKGDSCYVGQSTELLRLVDTTGDGNADRREIVLSGFGTEDTHHIVHTLRWGPDGRLYFNQSIYIHSHIETPWGVVRQNSGAIFALDPRTHRLEVLYNGFCNPWGHAFDQWGQSFVTDGAGFQGISWGVLGAGYFTYKAGRKILQSISPGTYPKFCGLEIIHSPHFPEDWQGSMVTGDYRAHRIVRFGITDLSLDKQNPTAGFVTTEIPDIVRTSDVAFRPIDVRLGPDGALYVADWSNPVINHGEVDFRDPRRDKTRGRIWRISRKAGEVLKIDDLQKKTAPELAEKLLSKNAWEKESARHLLMQWDAPEVEKTLSDMLARDNQDALQRELTWVALGKGRFFPLAESTDPHARAWAARVTGSFLATRAAAASRESAPSTRVSPESAFVLLDPYLQDRNPRVRLEALRAIARIAEQDEAIATAALSRVLDAALKAPEGDPLYEYAAWLSINDVSDLWLKALTDGKWKPNTPERQKQLALVLQSVRPQIATEALSITLAAREKSDITEEPWIGLVGKAGSAVELNKVRDALASGNLSQKQELRSLTALLEAARLRNGRPAGDLVAFARTAEERLRPRPDSYAALLRLIGQWKLAPMVPHLVEVAKSDAQPGFRLAAIDALRDAGGKEARTALAQLADEAEPEVARSAALALTAADATAGSRKALALVRSFKDEDSALKYWRALFAIKGASDAAAKLLKEESSKPTSLPAGNYATPQGAVINVSPAETTQGLQPIRKEVASAGLRAARELGKRGEAVAAALAHLAGVNPADAKIPQSYDWIANLVKRDGDPSRGEEIYRQPQLGCVTCHAIGGAGGKVGPELTSMGASAPLDYIIESIINPAAKVKEGYHAVTLALRDGGIAAGVQSRETAEEIFLRDVTGKETAVAKASVLNREVIGSLMPAGLIDSLPERAKLDLYAFLGQLGKPGVFDASRGNVARVWTLTASQPGTAAAENELAIPSYTLVDGRLTQEILKESLQMLPAAQESVFATARFHLPSGGKPRLQLHGVTRAWLNSKPLAVASEPEVATELPQGEHTLTVELSVKQLPPVLRAESADVRFLGND